MATSVYGRLASIFPEVSRPPPITPFYPGGPNDLTTTYSVLRSLGFSSR